MSETEQQQQEGDQGLTLGSKKKFIVPETFDVIETLVNPSKWTEIPVAVNLALIGGYTLCLFFGAPAWFFLVNFMFWRLCYNAGIGFLLYRQSNDHFMNKMASLLFEKYPNAKQLFVKSHSIRVKENGKIVTKPYEFDKYPLEFHAWMLFRIIVDWVLVNDVVCYIGFCIKYFEVPTSFGLLDVGLYVVGATLMLFNLWAKMDAHRVIGLLAWYWSDFFFTVDKSLKFDGIYNIAPHPMYSIGYSFMYGMAMITHSYTVLYFSFLAHMLQLTFLVIVETPHIEKIYGKLKNMDDHFKEHGYVSEIMMFFNLNIWEMADFFFVVIVLYVCGTGYTADSQWFHVAHVLVWRVFHSVVLGYILKKQSEDNFWNKRFQKKGHSTKDAFDSWKKLFNCSLTVNHLVYAMLAAKFFYIPEDWSTQGYIFKCFLGCVLIALQVWASASAYEVLGEFGWYYGDFFIQDKDLPINLRYNGIYRYFNNPELVLGYAAYYGLALISHNWTVFFMALVCHGLAVAFTQFVEKPHMNAKYGDDVREDGGVQSEIKLRIKPVVREIRKRVGTPVPAGDLKKKQ